MPHEDEGVDDLTLLRAAGAGDRAAFDGLVTRHGPAILRLVRSLAPDDADADDAFQNTFLAAYRAAGRFRGDASVRTWLVTIARRAVFRGQRRRSGEPAVHAPLEALGAAAGWGAAPDPETLAAAAEERTLLRRALEGLPEDEREAVALRDLAGLSNAEAAEVLGLTVAATKSRVHRARLHRMAARRPHAGGDDGA